MSAAAEELVRALSADAAPSPSLLFALGELYAADYDPAHIAAASRRAPTPETLTAGGALSPENDRALAFAALGYDALWRLTGEENWRQRRGAVLRELCLRPERHGPESLNGLCVLLAAAHEERRLLCTAPEEEPPAALGALSARYAPDLTLLLKTPARETALAAACPWTADYAIGSEPRFYLCNEADGSEELRF